MSRCVCGHKIALYDNISNLINNKSTLDIKELEKRHFVHITEPTIYRDNRMNKVSAEHDGIKYLDMTIRTESDKCPYCDCKEVKIASIGEDNV